MRDFDDNEKIGIHCILLMRTQRKLSSADAILQLNAHGLGTLHCLCCHLRLIQSLVLVEAFGFDGSGSLAEPCVLESSLCCEPLLRVISEKALEKIITMPGQDRAMATPTESRVWREHPPEIGHLPFCATHERKSSRDIRQAWPHLQIWCSKNTKYLEKLILLREPWEEHALHKQLCHDAA